MSFHETSLHGRRLQLMTAFAAMLVYTDDGYDVAPCFHSGFMFTVQLGQRVRSIAPGSAK